MRNPRVFIWQGTWQGGAETVMLGIAKFLRDHYGIKPVLGIFRGESDPSQDFKQIEVPRIFPKRLVAYNQIAASLLLGKQLSNFDLVITHCGGFWKRANNLFVYREPGDLDAMLQALPLKSKLLYFIPYLVALSSLRRGADLPIAASRRAAEFFTRHGVKNFFITTNFINIKNLPLVSNLSYEAGENFKVVFAGRDDKLKRLSLLKQAVALMGDPTVELHIFGVEGRDTINFKYHGWQRQDAVEQFLAHHTHVFVLPSLFEASPLTLLTALALGVPSVCGDNALPKEHEMRASKFGSLQELVNLLSQIQATYIDRKQTSETHAVVVRSEYDIDYVLKRELDHILSQIWKGRGNSRSWQVAQVAELDCWTQNKSHMLDARYLNAKQNLWRQIIRDISRHINLNDLQTKSVLEFGCGPAGVFTLVPQPSSYLCVDPLMDRYLHHFPFIRSSQVKFLNSKIEDLNADRKFDIILGFNALDHVDDINQTVFKLAQLIRPSGLLAISVNVHNLPWLQRLLRYTYPVFDKLHKHQYTDQQYEKLFQKAGLDVVEELGLDLALRKFVDDSGVKQGAGSWRSRVSPAGLLFNILGAFGIRHYGYEKPGDTSAYSAKCFVLELGQRYVE